MSANRPSEAKELRKILDAMLVTVSWQEQLVYQALDTVRSPTSQDRDRQVGPRTGRRKDKHK